VTPPAAPDTNIEDTLDDGAGGDLVRYTSKVRSKAHQAVCSATAHKIAKGLVHTLLKKLSQEVQRQILAAGIDH
jgi:hypothetical protein